MPDRSQRGFVLLAVLGILILASGLVYSRLGDERFLVKQVDFVARAEQARVLALSAVEPAKAVLAMDAQMGALDSLQERWAIPFAVPAPEGTVWVQISDVERKWNVNGLVTPDGVVNTAMLELLQSALEREGVDDAVLGELIDWLDSDSQYSLVGRGREARDYQADGYPYGPQNGPLRTVGELSLLPLWQAEVAAVLGPLVSAGNECGVDRLNINTAGHSALMAMEGYFSSAQVDELLRERDSEPFISIAEAIERIGFVKEDGQPDKSQLLSVSSRCFEVRIVAEYQGVSSDLRLNINRSNSGQGQSVVKVVGWQWKR